MNSWPAIEPATSIALGRVTLFKMRNGKADYEPPGGRLNRWLLSWGLCIAGTVGVLYGLSGLLTGKIIANSQGSWSLLEREDARVYGGLTILVGAVLIAVGASKPTGHD